MTKLEKIETIREAAENNGFWYDLTNQELDSIVASALTYLKGKRVAEIDIQISQLQSTKTKIVGIKE